MNRNSIVQFLAFWGYILFHVFIARKLVFGNYFFCYVYVGFLLSLSPTISRSKLLFIGFAMGLMIDLFEYSPGVHAAACVLLMFIRPYLVRLLATRSSFDEDEIREISIREISFTTFLLYALTLILVHHLTVFLLEAWTSKLILTSLLKTLSSTLLTLFSVIIVQYLFFTNRR